ncbi:MAG: stage II sporulation protein M [Bacteroidota bacterium]
MHKYLKFCKDYNTQIALIVLFLFFTIGVLGTKHYQYNAMDNKHTNLTLQYLFLNNSGYFLLLLTSCLYLNISTYPLIAYNSFFWGSIFKQVLCNANLSKALILFLPHGFFEIVWIVVITNASTKIAVIIYEVFNNNKKYFIQTKKLVLTILIACSFLILGVLVEYFITTKFL